ncbi:MAG: hypothetical protein AB8C95_00935 [Phycisphaeraceae bacterium]
MPYVDDSKPKTQANLPPILPWFAVIVIGALSPLLWLGSHLWFGYSYAGALLSGLLLGLAAKFTMSRPMPSLRVAAIILVVLGSFAGYIWVDSKLWTPFMFDKSMTRFFRDFIALLMIGFACYIAFALAEPRRATPTVQG